MLSDDSHHNRWVNRRPCSLAGITKDVIPQTASFCSTPPMANRAGFCWRLPASPSRRQRTARGPDDGQQRQASQRGVELLSSFGVTAFQDAAVSLEILGALRSLDESASSTPGWSSSLTSTMRSSDTTTWRGAHRARRAVPHRSPSAGLREDLPRRRSSGAHRAVPGSLPPDEAHGAHFHGTTTMDEDELYAGSRWCRAGPRCEGARDRRRHGQLLLDAVERLRGEGFSDTGPDGPRAVPGSPRHRSDGTARRRRRHLPLPLVSRCHPRRPCGGAGHDRAEHSQPNRSIIDAGGLSRAVRTGLSASRPIRSRESKDS